MGIQMNGYLDVVDKNRSFPYVFEDGLLTVYSGNSLPLDSKRLSLTKELATKQTYIIGSNLANQDNIIFFVDHMPFSGTLGSICTSTSQKVYYYIVLRPNVESMLIDKVALKFSELDYFYNTRHGIDTTYDENIFSLKTVPWKDTQRTFLFFLSNQKVSCDITVSQILKINSNTPLYLESVLGCEFDKTSDISFILNIYSTVKRLFCFLCFRKNVNINNITLYGRMKDARRTKIGELHIQFEHIKDNEEDKVIQKTIRFEYLQRLFSELSQLVADDNLYFEHIPNDSEDAHHVTIARVILNTAAFEWNFEQCYKNFAVSDYREQVKNDILTILEGLPNKNNYNSKKKSELKKYKKIISGIDSSLAEKIQYALNDCDSILSAFINNIYNLNKMEKETYSKIAERMQSQRNNFAHGNIDKEMNDNMVSDTIILEWLNYCMVFKSLDYSEDEIFNIINQIFGRRFTDKTIEDATEVTE